MCGGVDQGADLGGGEMLAVALAADEGGDVEVHEIELVFSLSHLANVLSSSSPAASERY